VVLRLPILQKETVSRWHSCTKPKAEQKCELSVINIQVVRVLHCSTYCSIGSCAPAVSSQRMSTHLHKFIHHLHLFDEPSFLQDHTFITCAEVSSRSWCTVCQEEEEVYLCIYVIRARYSLISLINGQSLPCFKTTVNYKEYRSCVGTVILPCRNQGCGTWLWLSSR